VKPLDTRLYVLTDCVPELGRTHEQVTAAAIEGGATMIQFRDKKLDDRSFANTAAALLSLTRAAGISLIINDRVAIAIAIGADGVHVGRHDGDVCKIRESLPPEMIFGVSAVNFDEAIAMDEIGADYLGVGPVFPTLSKEDATPPIGAKQLDRICRTVKTPVVAIGGMNMETMPRAIQAGVAGAAVISAVSHAADMAAAARNLIDIWEQKD
jgi:thiamine-phosphate pyrophosphorylase